MEFETHQVRETLLKVFTVDKTPDLRPEDSTFLTRPIRPHTIEIVCERDVGGEWEISTVTVQGYRVRTNGRVSSITWTAPYWASDFKPGSTRTIPAWFTAWVLQQASMI